MSNQDHYVQSPVGGKTGLDVSVSPIPLPVTTSSPGDVVVQVADGTIPTQKLAVTASGEAKVTVTESLPTGTNSIGQVTANAGSGNFTVIQPSGSNLHVNIDSLPAVTGTVTVNQGTSPWVDNITQFGGSNIATGTGTSGIGIPRVTVSNDSNVLATQSGTWTTARSWNLLNSTDSVNAMQSGTWNINNVSGTVSLPTGAATSANQATAINNQTNGTQITQISSLPAITGTVTANQGSPPWSVSGSGNFTVAQPIAANLNATVVQSLGSNLHVNVDSLPSFLGTVNAVQSATWNINNITGTISLPTGAATAANQTTTINNQTNNTQTTRITDGTNTMTVKAANTASTALDQSAVVALSHNSTLPTGTNAIGTTQYTNSGSGSIAANGATVTVNLNGASSIVFNVTGTFVGAVVAQGSTDGTNYFGLVGMNTSTGQNESLLASVVGALAFNTAGLKTIQLIGVFFASGTANIAWTASNGAGISVVTNTSAFPLFTSSVNTLKTTYAAATTIASAATATDIFTITGSATKTVKITQVRLSGIGTIGVGFTAQLIKRSAANTGGTSTSTAAVSYDSTNAAATATVLAYTANPVLGAAVGNIRADKIDVSTSGGGTNTVLVWDFGNRPAQAVVLRGIAQVLAINFNSTSITGGSINCSIEWTEE